MNRQKHVIVSPLDWGIGHAARMIPVINYLISSNCRVTLAAGRNTLKVLSQEFPQLQTVHLSSISPRYTRYGWSTNLFLVFQAPFLFAKALIDRQILKRFAKNNAVDLLISDNRIMLHDIADKSIYVTHQWYIKTGNRSPILSNMLSAVHQYFAKKYAKIMIPDFEDSVNLAGELSHPAHHHQIFYCGALSRFSNTLPLGESVPEKYFLALLSGPEPQRSMFEQAILNQAKTVDGKIVLVRGITSQKPIFDLPKNVEVFAFLHGQLLKKYIEDADFVVCRSGYTTVMDLVSLQKKAILVPTLGQHEQIYLAKHLDNLKLFPSIDQNNFELSKVSQIIANYPFAKIDFPSPNISEIEKLLG